MFTLLPTPDFNPLLDLTSLDLSNTYSPKDSRYFLLIFIKHIRVHIKEVQSVKANLILFLILYIIYNTLFIVYFNPLKAYFNPLYKLFEPLEVYFNPLEVYFNPLEVYFNPVEVFFNPLFNNLFEPRTLY